MTGAHIIRSYGYDKAGDIGGKTTGAADDGARRGSVTPGKTPAHEKELAAEHIAKKEQQRNKCYIDTYPPMKIKRKQLLVKIAEIAHFQAKTRRLLKNRQKRRKNHPTNATDFKYKPKVLYNHSKNIHYMVYYRFFTRNSALKMLGVQSESPIIAPERHIPDMIDPKTANTSPTVRDFATERSKKKNDFALFKPIVQLFVD